MKYRIKVASFFSFGRTGEVSEEGKELFCHTSCHAKKNKPKRSIFHRIARLFSLSFYTSLIFLSGAQQASAFCTSEVLVDNGNFTIGEYVNVFWYVPAGSGWYVANSPFDNPTGRAYTYKGPPVYENSDQVGGLYDTLNPAGNPAGVPATHMLNLLQETDGETSAIVYRFPRTFSAGDFKYSFDLSSRFKQNIFIDQYKVSLYNADTNTIEEVLEQDFVDTIPHAATETPGWTTLSS